MNKYLPIILIVAVLLFSAAGFFYVSSQKNGSILNKITDSTPVPSGANENNTALKEKITPPVPSEEVASSMIPLTVDSPKDHSSTTTSKVLVSGHTIVNADVFVNDVGTKADSRGNFKVNLTLDEGDNYILVFANDENGNYAQQDMTVTYEVK